MGCKKVTYLTQKKASDQAIKISIQNKQIGHAELFEYECPVCKKWHLTSNGQRKDKPSVLNRQREWINDEATYWMNRLKDKK